MMSHKPLPVIDSATVTINSLAQQKIASGIKVYNLSAGEPKLPPHKLVTSAVLTALERGEVFYPPVAGLPELKRLAAQWINAHYHCQYKPENALVVNGGKFGIYLLLQLLLQPKDEVIIAAPYWVSYPAITQIFGGIPKIIKTMPAKGWKLTAAQLKKACTANTRILILNSGANPTGAVYTRKELATLLKIAKQQNLWVIADEVYSGLIYADNYVSCGAFPEYQDRVIVIQSCSKNFAMTGWRIGFIFAAQPLITSLVSLVGQSTSGVTTVAQWAAIEVLKRADKVNAWVRHHMQQRRDILIQALSRCFGLNIDPPQASLYVFIALRDLGITHLTAQEFCQQAMEQANVALVPGEAFGQPGYVRLAFGASKSDLTGGVKALAIFCQKITDSWA